MPDPIFDFYAPFVSAVIESSVGRFPLWTRSQAPPSPDYPASLAYLESVSVQLMLGEVPIITANLTPPFQDAKALIDSPILEYGVSRLDVQFGYSGGYIV